MGTFIGAWELWKSCACECKNMSKRRRSDLRGRMGKKKEVVDVLLKHGAGANDKYDDEQSALMMAASDGSTEIAKLLMTHRADVNAVDKNQMTALMIACEKGHAPLVEALLKAGADINKKSKYGDTALSKAIAAKMSESSKRS